MFEFTLGDVMSSGLYEHHRRCRLYWSLASVALTFAILSHASIHSQTTSTGALTA